MAEELIIDNTATKEEKYQTLIPQIKALVTGEPDLTANLANIASALKYGMGFFWVGFYLVKDNELFWGLFRGQLLAPELEKEKGCARTSWAKAETVLVPNVDEFPGTLPVAQTLSLKLCSRLLRMEK